MAVTNESKSSHPWYSFEWTGSDPDVMREVYIDNRYSAPHLFMLLHEKYKILACGTVRSNCKGWDAKVMNLSKSSQRGCC